MFSATDWKHHTSGVQQKAKNGKTKGKKMIPHTTFLYEFLDMLKLWNIDAASYLVKTAERN